jgi:hypothetical protein
VWWRRRLQEEAGFISGYPSVAFAFAFAFARRRAPYLPAGSTTRPAAQITAIHSPVATLTDKPRMSTTKLKASGRTMEGAEFRLAC